MGIIDFLKPRKGAPASQAAEMEAALAKLREERKSVEATVDSYGQRRADALLSDATDADIAKIDSDANLAQIRLERLELAELELTERIAAARDSSERQRRAGKMDAAADAIEARAVNLEKAIDTLADAFTAFADVVPVKSPATRYEPGSGARPANNFEVARAVLAQGLFQRLPDAFEVTGREAIGAEFQIRMPVLYHRRDGSLAPGIPKDEAADLKFPFASGTADKIVVAPLRQVAAEIRAGRAPVNALHPAPRKAPLEPAPFPTQRLVFLRPATYVAVDGRKIVEDGSRETSVAEPIAKRAIELGLAVASNDPRAVEHLRRKNRRPDVDLQRQSHLEPEEPVDLGVSLQQIRAVERERLNEHREAAE